MTEKKVDIPLIKIEKAEETIETHIVIPDRNSTRIAKWVSKEVSASGSMLPKTEEAVLEMFGDQRSVVLVDNGGEPVAHAAITFVYDTDKVVEVGGVIVSDKWRKKGLGKQVTQASIDLARVKYPGWTMIALCNEQSLPIYLGLGATVLDIDKLEIIPKEAWEACASCPNYAETKKRGKICCDTLVLVP